MWVIHLINKNNTAIVVFTVFTQTQHCSFLPDLCHHVMPCYVMFYVSPAAVGLL